MTDFLLCAADPVALARLREALRDHRCWQCAWAELETALPSLSAGALILYVERKLPDSACAQLGTIRRAYPSLALVAYAGGGRDSPEVLRSLAPLPLDGVIVREVDDSPAGIRHAIERAQCRRRGRVLAADLRTRVAWPVPELVGSGVELAAEIGSVTEIVTHAGLRPLAARRALHRAGLPTARRLLGWARLIAAFAVLEEPARSADNAALAVGYSSGVAFRHACRRYLGLSPSAARSTGGCNYVVRELVATCGVRKCEPSQAPTAPGREARGHPR